MSVWRSCCPAAEAQGLKLGVGNRQGLEHLPLESDFQFLFRELASPALGYWHDVGHGQIKENLGLSATRCTWNRCATAVRISHP